MENGDRLTLAEECTEEREPNLAKNNAMEPVERDFQGVAQPSFCGSLARLSFLAGATLEFSRVTPLAHQVFCWFQRNGSPCAWPLLLACDFHWTALPTGITWRSGS